MKRGKPLRWWYSFPFWDGLGLGLLVGIVTMLIVFWLTDEKSELISKNIVSFFAIIASLSAALISLEGVRSRLNHDIEKKEDETSNLLIAAKAELPSALSTLSGIAQEQVEHIVSAERPLKRPQLDLRPDAFDAIKECIKYADPISQNWLALILMRYQVVVARAKPGLRGTLKLTGQQDLDGINLISAALDWAEYKAIVENAFEFARNTEKTIGTFDAKNISSSFFTLPILRNGTPDFSEALDRCIQHRKNAMPRDWFKLQ